MFWYKQKVIDLCLKFQQNETLHPALLGKQCSTCPGNCAETRSSPENNPEHPQPAANNQFLHIHNNNKHSNCVSSPSWHSAATRHSAFVVCTRQMWFNLHRETIELSTRHNLLTMGSHMSHLQSSNNDPDSFRVLHPLPIQTCRPCFIAHFQDKMRTLCPPSNCRVAAGDHGCLLAVISTAPVDMMLGQSI